MANNQNIEEELSKIKEEMRELKDLLKSKKENDFIDPPEAPTQHGQRIEITLDDEDFEFGEFDVGDINLTLNNYLSSVLSGVTNNFKRSMEGFGKGFATIEFNAAKSAEREVKRELKKQKKILDHEVRRIKKYAKNASKHHYKSRIIHLEKLNEEELEEFYEEAPNLISALSDKRRVKLLKLLENGPAYQGDLSDKTGIKGGTFKHHMDNLLSSKYVFQEATRGRYLITQLGVEALKLAEMLFRRYKFELKSEKGEINLENEDDNEGVEVEITNLDQDPENTEKENIEVNIEADEKEEKQLGE